MEHHEKRPFCCTCGIYTELNNNEQCFISYREKKFQNINDVGESIKYST